MKRSIARSSAHLTALGCLLSTLFLTGGASAQALESIRRIESNLLDKRLEAYRAAHQREREASQQLTRAVQSLYDVLGNQEISVDDLRRLETEITLARETAMLRAREATDLRREIYGRMERLEELDVEIAETEGLLSGTWTLDLGGEQGRGTATFRSFGNTVEGFYEMQDGSRGSLRGTLIDGTLELERIDSSNGRDRRLQGRLSGDGRQLEGTWQTYELASGRPAEGGWVARKVTR